MCVLCAAGERRIIRIGNGCLERGAEVVPSLAKIDLTGTAEHTVCQLAGAEAVEADQLRLLFGGRRSFLLRDAVSDQDCRDVSTSAVLTGSAEAAVAIEVEVLAPATSACRGNRDRQGRGEGRRRGVGLIIIGRHGLEAAKRSNAKPEAGRQRGAAEHIEREWVIAHRNIPFRMCAIPHPAR
ncbi:hypothetical protein D3C71_1362690 [compost metagenome]